MAYNSGDLTPVDTTDSNWALATLRFILRDTDDSNEAYSDQELAMALNLATFTVDSVDYYRPHVVAAGLIRADPDRAISESIDNASETRRDPASIAASILRSWGSIDDAILAASDARPSSNSFAVVF